MSGPETFDLAWTRGRRQPWGWAYWLTIIVAGWMCLGLMVAGKVIALLVAFAVGSAAIIALIRRSTRMYGGQMRLTEGGLRIERRKLRALARPDLVGGYRTGVSSAIVRTRSGEELHFALGPSASEGAIERILDHLQLGVGQRAITVQLRPMIGAFTLGLLAYFAWQPVVIGGVIGVWKLASNVSSDSRNLVLTALYIAPIILAVYTARRFGSPELVVGDDGVRVQRGLRNRLVPFRAIANVSADPSHTYAPTGVRIELRSGRVLTFRMYGQSVLQISGVVDRIVDAIRRTEKMPATIADALDRGSRPLGEWRSSIRSAVSGRGGFRDVVLPAEEVERVLEAAGTKPEQRIGAALALRELGALHPNEHRADARVRIRVAAEASADPHMRAMLEAAAEDEVDEAKLEALLRIDSR